MNEERINLRNITHFKSVRKQNDEINNFFEKKERTNTLKQGSPDKSVIRMVTLRMELS